MELTAVGDISDYGIAFDDAGGKHHKYLFMTSGKDGSVRWK
jgi:hypothetical protein